MLCCSWCNGRRIPTSLSSSAFLLGLLVAVLDDVPPLGGGRSPQHSATRLFVQAQISMAELSPCMEGESGGRKCDMIMNNAGTLLSLAGDVSAMTESDQQKLSGYCNEYKDFTPGSMCIQALDCYCNIPACDKAIGNILDILKSQCNLVPEPHGPVDLADFAAKVIDENEDTCAAQDFTAAPAANTAAGGLEDSDLSAGGLDLNALKPCMEGEEADKSQKYEKKCDMIAKNAADLVTLAGGVDQMEEADKERLASFCNDCNEFKPGSICMKAFECYCDIPPCTALIADVLAEFEGQCKAVSVDINTTVTKAKTEKETTCAFAEQQTQQSAIAVDVGKAFGSRGECHVIVQIMLLLLSAISVFVQPMLIF